MRNDIVSGIFLFFFHCTLFAQNPVFDFFDDFARKQGWKPGIEYQDGMKRGIELWHQKQYEKAGECFGQAALAFPRHPSPNFYLACILFQTGHYSSGGQIMRRVCSLPLGWEHIPLRFQNFVSPQELKLKLDEFEKWLTQKPRDLDSYFLFGFLCQFSGEVARAEMAYRVILSREPLYFEAALFLEMIVGKKVPLPYPSWQEFSQKGEQFLQKGHYELAIATWISASVYHAEQKTALYFLAYSLGVAGYYPQATSVLKLALQESPEILVEQIRKQARLKSDHATWIAKLETHFQKNSNHPDILFLLGYFYCVTREKSKAELAFKHLSKNRAYQEIANLFLRSMKDIGE